jgi:hypothetical protein
MVEKRPLLRLVFLPENADKEMANVQRDVLKKKSMPSTPAVIAGIYLEQVHHAK